VDGLLQVFRQAALVSDRRRKSIELKGARKLAGRILFQVAEGKDPQAERKAERNSGSFEELATRYVEEYSKVENKSWRQADALVRRHLFPKWAKMSAANITRGDVKAVKAGIESPTVANQTLAAASAIFSWAIVEEVAGVTANPVKGALAASPPNFLAPMHPMNSMMKKPSCGVTWWKRCQPIISSQRISPSSLSIAAT
jgi:hypothetical protein